MKSQMPQEIYPVVDAVLCGEFSDKILKHLKSDEVGGARSLTCLLKRGTFLVGEK